MSAATVPHRGSASALAVRSGLLRGWTEFRQSVTSREDAGWYVTITAILLGVLVWQRGGVVDDTSLSLGMLTLPRLLGMTVVFNGMVGVASVLAVEREDGTLLRAKAVPHGMTGYLVGVVVSNTLAILLAILLLLLPGVALVPEIRALNLAAWVGLLWFVVLGLVATLPWGAVLGSTLSNPRKVWGWGMLSSMVLVGISGIFYPVTALWSWVQGVAQIFPLYWIGHGMRWALLPDEAAAVELTGAWRLLETNLVLAAWAVAGLLVAPTILRRMARRESGSLIEARRHEAMQRV